MVYWYIMEAEKIDIGWIDPGYVHGAFAKSIAVQARDMEYHGCMGKIIRGSSSLPMRTKNQIIETWLKDSDNPWLWMVDADMYFSDGHPMKLWECASLYDAKLVSGLAFIYHQGAKPSPSYFIWGKGVEGFEDEDLVSAGNIVPNEPVQIAASGLASLLVHRDVFEAMQADFHDTFRWFHMNRENYKGDLYGEDMQFCVRAGELGFKQMLEPRAHTWHIKEIAIGLDDWKKAWNIPE